MYSYIDGVYLVLAIPSHDLTLRCCCFFSYSDGPERGLAPALTQHPLPATEPANLEGHTLKHVNHVLLQFQVPIDSPNLVPRTHIVIVGPLEQHHERNGVKTF